MLPDPGLNVLIAGAGPVGLAAAIELARRGYRPRIVSANDGPVHESRALGVNERTLQILGPCGVTDKLLAAGKRVRGIHLRTAERELFHFALPEPKGLPFFIILPQSEIEACLVEVLRGYGIEVEWRTELVDLREPDRPQVTLRTALGDTVATPDLLIAADGAHSRVRRALGLRFSGSAYETDWGLADVRVRTALSLDDAYAFDLAPVLLVVLPIRDNLVRLISDGPDVLARVPTELRVESVEWQSTFRISHRQVDTYQAGKVFLAGDAAHIHSPIGARGMNLGIEDAAWLAWMIAEGMTEGYTKARLPVGRRVLRTVDPATRLMASDRLLPKLIRRKLLPRIFAAESVRAALIRGVVAGGDPPPWLKHDSSPATRR